MLFAPSAQLRTSPNVLECEDSVDVVARLGVCVRWLIVELYIIEVGKTAKRKNGVLLLYAPLRLTYVYSYVCAPFLSVVCFFSFFFRIDSEGDESSFDSQFDSRAGLIITVATTITTAITH